MLRRDSSGILAIPISLARCLMPVDNEEALQRDILINPGGSGQSGVSCLQETRIDDLTGIVGSNYDLVSWDPRGLGANFPSANCTIPPKQSPEPLFSLRLSIFETFYNESLEIGAPCQDYIGGRNQASLHMTTATVSRDMLSIVDAFAASDGGATFNNSTLLNLLGFSYGTILGQTFASMFPRRIGRMVLDGVGDPDEWVNGAHDNYATNADEVFSTFFVYCNTAGSKYPFATGTSAQDFYLRFEALVDRLNSPANQNNWGNANFLIMLKDLIFRLGYFPHEEFPVLGQALARVEATLPDVESAALVIEQLNEKIGNRFLARRTNASRLWNQAVRCTDEGGVSYGKTLPEAKNTSWLVGEYHLIAKMACAGWNITSNDRYSGPFRAETNNPILFVSNTLDTITPHKNGLAATLRFPGFQLLTIDGVGGITKPARHISLQVDGETFCTQKKMRRFFQTRDLPVEDTYCPLQAGLWDIMLPGPLSSLKETRDIMEKLKRLTMREKLKESQ
ncbi:uncharacterized protein PAC_05911 [Phialocephala subalpina]|uniref:Peptidase S33 tripeptidyl aminopeptidase-like C-terminal domain-containing protein n=1 Tax=Phialocephala subalpina TaxID=576137 RepID=A0A1L7WTG9_9HELO|nr:uncharacterized protein PAC_05911 [Phialocephala subalpina]